MSNEDELLFGQAKTKAKFGNQKVTAEMKRQSAAAMDSMDLGDLVGSSETHSLGTGLDFSSMTGTRPSPAAPGVAAAAPEKQSAGNWPQAAAFRETPATAPTPATTAANARAARQERGFFARLLGLFGLGRRG